MAVMPTEKEHTEISVRGQAIYNDKPSRSCKRR